MAGFGFNNANDYGFEGREVFNVASQVNPNHWVVDFDTIFPEPLTTYSYKVDDFMYWLLLGLNKAEKRVNEIRTTHRSNTFRDPVYSPPVLQSNGEWWSTVTFTVALKVRVDKPDSAVEA